MNGNELAGYDLILPAQLNVLRPESWTTVAVHPGGPEAFEVAVAIMEEVEALTNAG